MIKKLLNRLFRRKTEQAISFKQGFDLTELPIVTFYQGSKKLNFLLDTGSNNNIINSSALEQVEALTVDKASNLYGIGGRTTNNSMCQITFSYRDRDYTFDYIVADMSSPFQALKQEFGVTVHGIIGSRFFNHYKYILDFDELIAYSKQ